MKINFRKYVRCDFCNQPKLRESTTAYDDDDNTMICTDCIKAIAMSCRRID